MHGTESAYGLWTLVIINSAIFIIFAFSFFKPQTKRDWRSFSAFSAFIVALFVEMYGFPLTIYLFSGWLTANYPGVDFLSHENGHLLHTIFGFEGNAHFDPLHMASIVFIVMVVHEKLPGNDTLIAVVNCTVALSIIAHGVSAVPLAKMYGKLVADRNGVI